MISIPKNDIPMNRFTDEAEELKQNIVSQIENSLQRFDPYEIKDDGESRCIARFKTHCDTRYGNHEKVWSVPAANIVVNELKSAGYFVWFSDTTYDEEDYWVTAINVRPHGWFHRI